MNVDLFAVELERDEDLRLKPYRDQFGNWTIGVGRNLTANGISRQEARYLLRNDMNETMSELDQHLPWWRRLDEVRQRVLANMCFNMGIERLFTFRKMLAALQLGNYDLAADEMADSAWAREVGERAVRLVAMMRTGSDITGTA